MARITFVKIITGIVVIAVLMYVSISVLLPRVLNLDSYKTDLLNILEASLKRPVTFDSAVVSWHILPAVVVKGLTIKDKTGDTKLLTVDRLTFRVALLPLLHKEVRLQGVVLDRPELKFVRNSDGTFSFDDLLTGTPSTLEVFVDNIRIVDGRLRFTDHPAETGALTTTLEQLNVQINGLKRGSSSGFRLSAVVHDQGRREELSLSGEAVIPRQGESLSMTRLDASLSVKNLNLARYWPYYGRFLPFENMHGQLDGEATLQGRLGDFTSEGHINLKKLQFEYPKVFHATIAPEEVDLRFNGTLDSQNIKVTSADLTVDGLQLKGSGALLAWHDTDPHLKVKLSSSPLPIEELKRYIPYGGIPKGTSDFIERYIKAGMLRVREVALDGRISQLLNLGVGTNYTALSLHATVENGRLHFGPQVPPISNIRTDLEFRGKDFSLRNTSGLFGASPFTLEGTIAGYPLATPASYPFSLKMTPAQSEIDWLLHQEKEPKLTVSGPSTLILSGAGSASEYRLSGSWDLSGAACRFSSFFTKPAGMMNRVAFGAVLGATEARLSEFHYDLPSLTVTANATYRYNAPVPLTCTATATRFDVAALLPVLHGLDPYHPSGMATAAITASGNPGAPDTILWKGAVTLAGLSLRPSEQIAPLSGINGSITISGSGLETKQLTGKIGKSDVTVSGSVRNFTAPVAALHVSSPLLHLRDIGFTTSGQAIAVKNVSSKLTKEGSNLTIESLTGQLNQTAIALHGDLRDVKNPDITLRVHFPSFKAEDLLLLRELRREGRTGAKSGEYSLNARVTIDAGTVGNTPFTELDTRLFMKNNHVDIKKTSLDVFGGKVSGSGTVDLSSQDGPLYQVNYRVDNIDVTQLFSLAGKEKLLTGLLTSEGHLSATGKNPADLKKGLRGSAKLSIKEGMINSSKNSGIKVPFYALDGKLSYKHETLSVQDLSMTLLGGTLSGSGSVDMSPQDGPLYASHYRLDNVDVTQLLAAVGKERVISGRLTSEGDLTARGNSVEELENSLRGSNKFQMEKGLIYKSNVLLKIFSIFNVTRILKFRLPRIAQEGTQYDSIQGNFTMSDGSAETTDLSLQSPSVAVKAVGKADYVKKELDMVFAVQPLQTISYVVSRIPLIGWLLTGGNQSFLVTFFDVKGSWSNPEVSTRPVENLSIGVYNIFKRTFMLPETLFTDTNKVLFN